jgi:hypothetical protein
VHDYLARFVASGLSWSLPVEVGEAELEGALFPPEVFRALLEAPLVSCFSQLADRRETHKPKVGGSMLEKNVKCS